jgi:hypothetical protein
MKRYVMPETRPGTELDERGVCNSICRQAEQKRQEELACLLEEHRAYAVSHRTEYDCLVGCSGGKHLAKGSTDRKRSRRP